MKIVTPAECLNGKVPDYIYGNENNKKLFYSMCERLIAFVSDCGENYDSVKFVELNFNTKRPVVKVDYDGLYTFCRNYCDRIIKETMELVS